MTHSCHRCNQEIPEGGLFYHVKLSAVSGYDGVIDVEHESEASRILDDIKEKSSEDLERDVYFEQEVILCHACRKVVVETLCAEMGTAPDSNTGPDSLLH